MLRYQDLLDIGLSPDAETLQARLVAAAAQLGFGLSGGTFVRGRLASGRELVKAFGNPPAEFLEASRSVDIGLRDPLLTAIVARPGCYTYDADFYLAAGAGDLYELLDGFQYRHGMAISLHEHSHQELFSFGVDGPDALPTKPTARFELEGALRLIAMHAHEASKRLFTQRAAPVVDMPKAEREALRWASDAEVIWKRGSVTVISNPGKTGDKTSPRAVLRAIDGGLIER